jgi:hypothetical protein
MFPLLKTIGVLALLLSAGSDPIFTLLPGNGVPAGWQRKGEGRLYAGAALYQHINGGAELYNQFGFDRLAVQDYASDVQEIRVEIYKMKDETGSTAVFAEITRDMAMRNDFGSACVLDEYQVMFRRKSYCVSLTSYESDPSLRQAMATLAATIDAALLEPGR